MAARTYNYNQLAARVGEFLGYGSNSANWDADQTEKINFSIKSGLTWFYEPDQTPNFAAAHNWRFLEMAALITTSTEDTQLPADFGGMDGTMTLTSANGWPDVPIVGEDMIRRQRALNSAATGAPKMAAIRAKAVSGSATQRFELMLYPNPSGTSYTLRYRYRKMPDMISGTEEPYGGAAHAETVLAACIAAADFHYNDTLGDAYNYYIGRLNASIRRDARANVPDFYGYNGDNSDFLYGTTFFGKVRQLNGWEVGGGSSFTTGSEATVEMIIETDRLTMTGSEVTYTIPGGVTSLIFRPKDGDVTMTSATGGDAYTILYGETLSISASELSTMDLFFTGTNAHIVEITLVKESA